MVDEFDELIVESAHKIANAICTKNRWPSISLSVVRIVVEALVRLKVGIEESQKPNPSVTGVDLATRHEAVVEKPIPPEEIVSGGPDD